jgi:hypothetical protein
MAELLGAALASSKHTAMTSFMAQWRGHGVTETCPHAHDGCQKQTWIHDLCSTLEAALTENGPFQCPTTPAYYPFFLLRLPACLPPPPITTPPPLTPLTSPPGSCPEWPGP